MKAFLASDSEWDLGLPIGIGPSPTEAIIDLLEQENPEDDILDIVPLLLGRKINIEEV